MAKSKCPVCDVRVPAVAGPWKRLCAKHEGSYNSFPDYKFPEDDAVLVRGAMIKREDESSFANLFEDEIVFDEEDVYEDCFA